MWFFEKEHGKQGGGFKFLNKFNRIITVFYEDIHWLDDLSYVRVILLNLDNFILIVSLYIIYNV
jgi:hypothetical protein